MFLCFMLEVAVRWGSQRLIPRQTFGCKWFVRTVLPGEASERLGEARWEGTTHQGGLQVPFQLHLTQGCWSLSHRRQRWSWPNGGLSCASVINRWLWAAQGAITPRYVQLAVHLAETTPAPQRLSSEEDCKGRSCRLMSRGSGTAAAAPTPGWHLEDEIDLFMLLGSWPIVLTGLCKRPLSYFTFPALSPVPTSMCPHRYSLSCVGDQYQLQHMDMFKDYRFT